ncbi:MAG: hypothetical protein AAF442_02055 [Pseudomonadota bacterium]
MIRMVRVMGRSSRLGFFLILVGIGLAAGDAVAVSVRGWDHGDYGRLVFDWPGAQTTRYEVIGGTAGQSDQASQPVQVVISFAAPMPGTLSSPQRRLSRYITAYDLGAERRRLVLTLADGLAVQTLDLPGRKVFDFRQTQASPELAEPVPPAQPAPSPVPSVQTSEAPAASETNDASGAVRDVSAQPGQTPFTQQVIPQASPPSSGGDAAQTTTQAPTQTTAQTPEGAEALAQAASQAASQPTVQAAPQGVVQTGAQAVGAVGSLAQDTAQPVVSSQAASQTTPQAAPQSPSQRSLTAETEMGSAVISRISNAAPLTQVRPAQNQASLEQASPEQASLEDEVTQVLTTASQGSSSDPVQNVHTQNRAPQSEMTSTAASATENASRQDIASLIDTLGLEPETDAPVTAPTASPGVASGQPGQEEAQEQAQQEQAQQEQAQQEEVPVEYGEVLGEIEGLNFEAMRITELEDRTRIDFEWNQPTPHLLRQLGEEIRMTFGYVNGVDLTAVRGRDYDRISAITAARGEMDGTTDFIIMPKGAFLTRSYVGGDVVTLELIDSEDIREIALGQSTIVDPLQDENDPLDESFGDTPTSRSVRILFEQDDPFALAVVNRGPEYLVVFARETPLESDLFEDFLRVFDDARQVRTAQGIAVRLRKGHPDALLFGTLEEGSWFLQEVTNSRQINSTLGVLDFNICPVPHCIQFEGLEPGPMVSVEGIMVFPSYNPNPTVQPERSFPSFRTLPTTHGVAIVPMVDSLEIQAQDNSVMIAHPQGLLTSVFAQRDKGSVLFRTVVPVELDAETFAGNWARLQRRAALTSTTKGTARQDLARFYISYGLYPDAVGVLHVARDENPFLLDNPEFKMMLAAAEILSGNYEPGLRLMQSVRNLSSQEGALWRAITAARQGLWREAHAYFRQAGDFAVRYPRPLASEFAMLSLQAAVNTQNYDQINVPYMELLREMAVDNDEIASGIAYFQGLLDIHYGLQDNARDAFGDSIANASEYIKLMAQMAIIESDYQTGVIDTQMAVDRFDRLRYRWRGDFIEFEVMRRFGELLWQVGQGNQMMDVWEQAVDEFSDYRPAQELEAQLQDKFTTFFTADDAPATIDPVASYEAFQIHNDILDSHATRLRIMARLAAILSEKGHFDLSVNLLAELAQAQPDPNRRALIGARISQLSLLQDDPQEALLALEDTAVELDDISPDVLLWRQALRASAYTDQGNYEQALAALAGNDAPIAQEIRQRIAREQNNWPELARLLQLEIPPPPALGEPLPDDQAEMLTRYAVALSLADDRETLNDLAISYGPSMALTPFSSPFSVATDLPFSQDRVGLEDIRRTLQETDIYQETLLSEDLFGSMDDWVLESSAGAFTDQGNMVESIILDEQEGLLFDEGLQENSPANEEQAPTLDGQTDTPQERAT